MEPSSAGLPAGRATEHRRMLAREWLRDRFWAVPSMLLGAGVLLAVVTAEADALGLPAAEAGWLPVGDGVAERILGVIATSMLTFVGVVFTITLVALQLASAQLSPRVLRTFVRSFVTKLAFGIFLATFAFAMTVLVLDEARADPAVDSRAVTVASLLVAVSLLVFVGYVTATMKLLQVSWVITAVTNETRRAVAANFSSAGGLSSRRCTGAVRLAGRAAAAGEGRQALGVLRGVDRGRLVELGRRHDCVLELIPRVGAYLHPGTAVFAVHGGSTPPPVQAIACLDLGRARTLY